MICEKSRIEMDNKIRIMMPEENNTNKEIKIIKNELNRNCGAEEYNNEVEKLTRKTQQKK